ncbi:MAG TPA: adenylate/guanylate cyclase domain-containing protein [Mariprofundaceae bacterium]|nr:adenylate/guanylate cyclase domain-containing protein [Mariprofundaceae bacterium]
MQTTQRDHLPDMDPPSIDEDLASEELSPRFPVRWRWTMLVGFAVAVSIVVLFLIILDMERDAWLDSQAAQAEVQVDRLADSLKIPMLAGSTAEIELTVQGFLKKVPSVMGVHLQYANGGDQHFGTVEEDDALLHDLPANTLVKRLPAERMWYVKKVVYAGVTIGAVGVRFSEQAWQELAGELVTRISIAAVVVIILSSILVYWIAGRMSQPLEMLANAARHVAYGDYTIRLPVRGNDEISDAISQFNSMVGELAHKEELRDVFGRYLNPKLVSEVFDTGQVKVANRRQEVTVLFADMVQFTSFSESTSTEEVVDVLNKHFEVFHRVIDYYGGHVDKYIGDAVMAVFNHPNEDPDHARHAAKAGLAMTIACSKLGVLRSNGEPISFRVGLNRGEAIVGNIGAAERQEYTVIGDTVNVASRMGGLGEGGEVVMSEATFALLGDGFEFNSIGIQDIKGVSQPLQCGSVRPGDDEVVRNIAHAVALAFDLTLPSDVRHIIGDI